MAAAMHALAFIAVLLSHATMAEIPQPARRLRGQNAQRVHVLNTMSRGSRQAGEKVLLQSESKAFNGGLSARVRPSVAEGVSLGSAFSFTVTAWVKTLAGTPARA